MRGSKIAVEGLKSTSDKVLLLNLRLEGNDDEGEGEKLGCRIGSPNSFRSELGEAWWELGFSGVTTSSFFSRASRRAFSFSARCTSCRILGSIQKSSLAHHRCIILFTFMCYIIDSALFPFE